MDYAEDLGWHDARIIPYGPFPMDPACAVMHYGQAVFEGMKAYRSLRQNPALPPGAKHGSTESQQPAHVHPSSMRTLPCRPLHNWSLWIGIGFEAPGTALYLRPFVFATDSVLGVRASSTYRFMVILSPVGPYYQEGLNPVSIWVEPHYIRAVRGGTGYAKAAGNYAGSLLAQKNAQAKGYSQVLWLDGLERKYVEEVGAMNVFFNIGGVLITPDLGDSILPGITRDSVLTLLRSWDIPTEERDLEVAEIFRAHAEGRLVEAFGCGTAAVISPIGRLGWKDQAIEIGGGKIGAIVRGSMTL